MPGSPSYSQDPDDADTDYVEFTASAQGETDYHLLTRQYVENLLN